MVLTADPGARWLVRALRAGASAVVPGELSPAALATVLHEVLASEAAGALPALAA